MCTVTTVGLSLLQQTNTNIYYCCNEHTDELLTTNKTHSQYSNLLCLLYTSLFLYLRLVRAM
jgi:hypothetical protein